MSENIEVTHNVHPDTAKLAKIVRGLIDVVREPRMTWTDGQFMALAAEIDLLLAGKSDG